ncbi:CRISPR-associated RAMP protein Csx7 [Sorangium sp. So ce1036]|uniref:type III CRISPR-associated RAMP protein Csx7 n=1 Tax=Sorangium sp. So ce1036 TaxID=3133328 RepID=UPI003F0C3DD1
MFKKSYNRAVLGVRVETVTPLLIRAGDAGIDPTAADLSCVRTRHAVHGRTVYIPGSSLKGVIRSAAEASVRGETFGGARGACNPLDHKNECNAHANSDRFPTATIYRDQCLACRLFGSLAIKGRAAVRDLFPWLERGDEAARPGGTNHQRANQVEQRHGVAIDRILGSVKPGALFDQELVPAGVAFWGEIALENYQVWQLGLLVRALDEISEGFAQLGSSKSRGLGFARAEVISIVHEQPLRGGERPAGVGKLMSPEEHAAYGLLREPDVALPALLGEPRGLSRRFATTDSPAIQAWIEAARQALGEMA